jgi:hypothetical protein
LKTAIAIPTVFLVDTFIRFAKNSFEKQQAATYCFYDELSGSSAAGYGTVSLNGPPNGRGGEVAGWPSTNSASHIFFQQPCWSWSLIPCSWGGEVVGLYVGGRFGKDEGGGASQHTVEVGPPAGWITIQKSFAKVRKMCRPTGRKEINIKKRIVRTLRGLLY